MRRLSYLALMIAGVAWGKPWHGITPGTSTSAEVQRKLGDPTRVVNQGATTLLGYSGDDAVAGARQAEFTIGSNHRVEQIAVFPDQVIDRPTVESTFGPDCATQPREPCYQRKLSEEDFKVYFYYRTLGLVVFFDKEQKSVESFLYVAPEAEKPAPAAAAGGSGKPATLLKPPPGPPPGPPSADLAKLGGAK